jgi:GAF domain-containing protein
MVATVTDVLDVETCGFFLHDRERDELVLQRPGFDAYDEDVFAFFHIPLGRPGETRKVFLNQQPAYANDILEDPTSPWYRGCLVVNARNVLVVPLVVESRSIGVLSLMNKCPGPFDDADVELAMQIAPHLALAIDAAAKHQKLEEQQRQLDRALQVHAQLSTAIVSAPNVAPVAESLARLLDRPVVVLDATLSILVWANDPDLHVDRADLEAELRAALASVPARELGRSALRLQLGISDARQRAAMATRVTAGDHIEGYLAVIEMNEPLDVVDARALEHAATLVAFQLLRERTALEVERRLRGEVFEELLTVTHGTERGALALLERLGASSVGPWRVARFELLAPAGIPSPNSVAFDPRLAAAVSSAWAQAGIATPLVPWRSGFACVLPDDAATDAFPSRVVDTLNRSISGLEVRDLHYVLTLGAQVASATDLSRSLDQAEDALALAARLGFLDRVMRFEDLAVERVLLESMDASSTHEVFVQQVLGRLLAHDEQNNRDLLGTLRAYVAADYAPILVARQLFIHPNTVHFRIRRLSELLGSDWPHGDQRFRVELALRLMDLLEIRAQQRARQPHAS